MLEIYNTATSRMVTRGLGRHLPRAARPIPSQTLAKKRQRLLATATTCSACLDDSPAVATAEAHRRPKIIVRGPERTMENRAIFIRAGDEDLRNCLPPRPALGYRTMIQAIDAAAPDATRSSWTSSPTSSSTWSSIPHRRREAQRMSSAGLAQPRLLPLEQRPRPARHLRRHPASRLLV